VRKILNIDPVWGSISNSYRTSSRIRPAAHTGLALVGIALLFAPILVGAAAVAADMPMNMPVKAAAPPVINWTGCYVGANVGGGASGSNFDSAIDPGTHLFDPDRAVVAGSGAGSHGGDGLLAGGQVGCNIQSGLLVAGLEGDFDYFHSNPFFVNNTNTLSDGVTPFTITQSVKTDYLATIRPRVGIASDRNLAYLTAGVAFARVNYLETYSDGGAPAGSGSAAASKSLVGWVAGAGWEYALADHWTFRAEYLYAGFSKVNAVGAITDPGGGANVLHGSSDLTIQALRAGVNYKF